VSAPHPDRHPISQDARDRRVEEVVGQLLRLGVLVAAVVTLAGGILLLLAHGGERADFGTFRGEASPLRSVGAVVRGALALDPPAVAQLGLVLLVATPIARVALTLVAFIRARDRLYTAMTALVLALLTYALVFGG
jgi:uncharacterized membrane protein